jgi:hypothetical protein
LSKFYQTTCVALLTWLLSSCATLQGPSYYYNEVVVLNQSRTVVRDVEILSTESGRVFSCDNIAPRGICSNKFQPQLYRGSPVQIAWAIGDGSRRDEIVELELPADFVPEIPLRGVLVIGARGAISAHLQQDSPGPHL